MLEEKIEDEERSGILSRLRDSRALKYISKALIPLMAAGWMYFGNVNNANALVADTFAADTNGQQTGNTFRTTSEAVCKEDGKPIIRFFSSTLCGPCRWIKDTYDSVVKEYAKQGKIKAYRWELDTKDDGLTPDVEGKIPDSELSIFNKNNPMGGTPLFVFGCKYVRVGVGYNNLNAEEKEFRQIIDSLVKEVNIAPKNSVLIFVDSDTYSKLSDRIERYKEDIENDVALDADVGVFQNNWKDIKEIRNIILDYYNNRGLLGSIFIGDVPTAHFEEKNGGGDIISDVYFSDLNNRFFDTDNDGKFELETLNLPKEIWSARIKSPINGEEGIKLLKNYFDKNHAYRQGEIKFEQKMMFFDNFSSEWRSKEQLMTELEDLTKSPALYGNTTDIAFFYKPHNNVSELFLSEIKKPYEFGYLIVHGFATNNIVYYDKIKEVGSNVFFLILNSCHNGDFKTENYIAGWYLFSGNSLVVEAMTTASCALSRTDEIIRYKQADTLTFGEIYKDNTAIEVHLFGDPTLRFRMQPQKEEEEIISKKEDNKKEIINKEENADAYYNQGVTCYQNVQYQEAIEAFKKAVEIDPDYAKVWYSLGEVWYDRALVYMGYLPEEAYTIEAINAYKKAIEVKPDYAEARYKLGKAWLSLGEQYKYHRQYQKAIEAYKKAIEINPDDASIWGVGLGNSYHAVGDYKKADECFKRAEELR